ncbi:hypothetical protein [Winogradskyella haliclonae]|uniref:SMODS-associating 2TM beta-strand rich effector domain-containing protein n=1 Tax=Winogradskyella haliclonae TaxID=2048558 RepID=A0ABQ2BVK6_9FLAO|nr:hypothetical protein [Winogradskyella haliclonae]GGI56485.1 hypothetical protein GCM10011444_07940 [Winogradskyella haliclonae]
MNSKLIITGSKKSLWQTIVAAFIYTLAILLIFLSINNGKMDLEHINRIADDSYLIVIIISIAVGFSSIKRIYVDIENSRFRPTFEVLFMKFGKWKTINNYEYISVFRQPLKNGDYIFDVNLWFDRNKHIKLYDEHNYVDAFKVGFLLSEELEIDILDSTTPNNYKWVDKEKYRFTKEVKYTD